MTTELDDDIAPECPTCTTHHFACDCREAAHKKEVRELKEKCDRQAERLNEKLNREIDLCVRVEELKDKLSVAREALEFFKKIESGIVAREALKKIGEKK
jgi:predicted TIM-barrel fold metal-dependent hydrolase